jgi:hypothetical protein
LLSETSPYKKGEFYVFRGALILAKIKVYCRRTTPNNLGTHISPAMILPSHILFKQKGVIKRIKAFISCVETIDLANSAVSIMVL